MRAALCVAGLLVVGGSALVQQQQISETTGTQSQARAAAWLWLRVHAWDRQPQDDELADLKSADPNSYALVSALLAKQQMGILNPRHPSEGFASTGTHLSAEDAASLARMEASVVKKPAPEEAPAAQDAPQAVYTEAGAAQHDWRHFKAEDADDEIVASLGGGSGSLLSEAQEVVPNDPSPLAPSNNVAGMEIPIISWGASRKPAAPRAAPVARAAVQHSPIGMSQSNSYLAPGGIDFAEFIPSGEKAPAAPRPKAAMSQQDMYLSSLGFDLKSDLMARKPKPVQKAAAPAEPVVQNALTDFDFNTAPVEASAAQTNSYVAKVDLPAVTEQKADHVNPYLQMMGEDQPQASLLSSRVSGPSPLRPRQPSNRYLQAINFGEARHATNLLGAYENDLEA